MPTSASELGIALHCIALHCIALHCIALHCIALHDDGDGDNDDDAHHHHAIPSWGSDLGMTWSMHVTRLSGWTCLQGQRYKHAPH